MKKFEQPEVTVLMFSVTDILATSAETKISGQGVQGVPIYELFDEVDK